MEAGPKLPPVSSADTPDEIESQFYEALRKGDLERLMAVWADDDEIVCVHPGGPRTIGLAAIRASFEAIFANGVVPVAPEQVHRLQGLSTAVHHLAERIVVDTEDGPRTAWVLATNVYLKTPLGWRMAAHHASPGTLQPPEPDERPSTLH
jgi:uncharacterized protein (TIGR02246 family)